MMTNYTKHRTSVHRMSSCLFNWIDNKITENALVTAASNRFYYTPDEFYLGHRTFPMAVKNHALDAMVVPDYRTSALLPGGISHLGDLLLRCGRKRIINGRDSEGMWASMEDENSKTWVVAPVDEIDESLKTCDLATLQSRSKPVLERWLDKALRNYSKMTSPRDQAWCDETWNGLAFMHERLGLAIPKEFEAWRTTTVAKARLKK